MKIYTVWATRPYTPTDPELVVAWDEYSVDSNPEGYDEDVKKSLASWGTDLHQHRFIEIEVDDTLLGLAFGTHKMPGQITSVKERATLEHSDVVLENVHPSDSCQGETCTIHNRSDHSMREFPQHWRGDRGIMERTCPHGVGHPDPDSPWPPDSVEWDHGCDGCCARQ